jgi:hypothetical protein
MIFALMVSLGLARTILVAALPGSATKDAFAVRPHSGIVLGSASTTFHAPHREIN